MKPRLPTALLFLLLMAAGNAQAWWETPYNGYWPNAWPAPYGQPAYGPYGSYGPPNQAYSGPDWNMRGYVTDRGDMHVVIEYRGNVNNDFFGGNGGYPGYGAYPPPPYNGYGWR